jgi:hypothetical protein
MATQFWCDTCRRTYPADRVEDGICPQGHDTLIPVGRFSGMVKAFIAAGGIEERSDAQNRHRQLIHALWAQGERDQQFYQLLAPKISLGRFVKQMDALHLRGVAEGWIKPIIPTSPFAPISDYGIEYDPPERFIIEVYKLFDVPLPDGIMDQAAVLATIPVVEASERSKQPSGTG